MSGYQTNLLTGFAVLLNVASVGTWNASGAYTSGQTGIALRVIPQSPDSIIALTTYSVTDDPSLSDTVTGLQVLTRKGGQDPRTVDDLADDIFDQLHGLHDVLLSTGIHVVQCLHRSGTPLPEDDLHRWSRSDNYYVTTHRPSPNRT